MGLLETVQPSDGAKVPFLDLGLTLEKLSSLPTPSAISAETLNTFFHPQDGLLASFWYFEQSGHGQAEREKLKLARDSALTSLISLQRENVADTSMVYLLLNLPLMFGQEVQSLGQVIDRATVYTLEPRPLEFYDKYARLNREAAHLLARFRASRSSHMLNGQEQIDLATAICPHMIDDQLASQATVVFTLTWERLRFARLAVDYCQDHQISLGTLVHWIQPRVVAPRPEKVAVYDLLRSLPDGDYKTETVVDPVYEDLIVGFLSADKELSQDPSLLPYLPPSSDRIYLSSDQVAALTGEKRATLTYWARQLLKSEKAELGIPMSGLVRIGLRRRILFDREYGVRFVERMRDTEGNIDRVPSNWQPFYIYDEAASLGVSVQTWRKRIQTAMLKQPELCDKYISLCEFGRYTYIINSEGGWSFVYDLITAPRMELDFPTSAYILVPPPDWLTGQTAQAAVGVNNDSTYTKLLGLALKSDQLGIGHGIVRTLTGSWIYLHPEIGVNTLRRLKDEHGVRSVPDIRSWRRPDGSSNIAEIARMFNIDHHEVRDLLEHPLLIPFVHRYMHPMPVYIDVEGVALVKQMLLESGRMPGLISPLNSLADVLDIKHPVVQGYAHQMLDSHLDVFKIRQRGSQTRIFVYDSQQERARALILEVFLQKHPRAFQTLLDELDCQSAAASLGSLIDQGFKLKDLIVYGQNGRPVSLPDNTKEIILSGSRDLLRGVLSAWLVQEDIGKESLGSVLDVLLVRYKGRHLLCWDNDGRLALSSVAQEHLSLVFARQISQRKVSHLRDLLSEVKQEPGLLGLTKVYPPLIAERKYVADPDDLISAGLLSQYFYEVGQTPLLTANEEVVLAEKIESGLLAAKEIGSRDGLSLVKIKDLEQRVKVGEAARHHMIKANLRLVVSRAKKYRKRGMQFLDLIQQGNIGLMRAIKGFDYQRGNKFSTYAIKSIDRAIQRLIGDHSRTIRLSIHAYKQIKILQDARRALAQELGQYPSIDELASETGISTKRIELVLQSNIPPASLEESVSRRDGKSDTDDTMLLDLIEDYDFDPALDQLARLELKDQVLECISILSAREIRLLDMRFGLGITSSSNTGREMTLQEIGLNFGLTRERIRQIEAAALGRLRHSSRAQTLRDHL